MDKKCINCNYFIEEGFGNPKLDLENGMICSCVDSKYYDNHVTQNDNCEHWIELL